MQKNHTVRLRLDLRTRAYLQPPKSVFFYLLAASKVVSSKLKIDSDVSCSRVLLSNQNLHVIVDISYQQPSTRTQAIVGWGVGWHRMGMQGK